ncbi:hypothetical protein [Caulobacter segnis]
MKSLKTALVLGTSISALATGGAMAQTAKPDETMMITEVVVTAQKREEKLQDVPIAVSVVGETDLQRPRRAWSASPPMRRSSAASRPSPI